jgi:hypothetical protein
MPVSQRELTGDEGRGPFGAVFDDLGEVARRVNLTMSGRRFNLTTPSSVFGPERQTPLADRFVGHHDPALREEIFDVPAN